MNLVDTFVIFLEIILIDLLLSGDNAIVIAMAARKLPLVKRRKAIWWGSFIAIILRCCLTYLAIVLLKIPFLQTIGALLLLGIAYHLMLGKPQVEHERSGENLVQAVGMIAIADFVMSLDNVLAVTAIASGDVMLTIIGIVISIPILIWGSSFILNVMDRLPWLVYVGGTILAYTAAQMALRDVAWSQFPYFMTMEVKKWIPLLTVLILLLFTLWRRKE